MSHARTRPAHEPQIERLHPRRYLSGLAVPPLNSAVGAPAYLYLDFDGDVARRWYGRDVQPQLPYDLDRNATSFNPLELDTIRETFSRVADMYSPFNINV